MSDLRSVGESRALQPRALIVTAYGAFARDFGGWLSVAALIRLMAELEVELGLLSALPHPGEAHRSRSTDDLPVRVRPRPGRDL